MDRDLDRNPDPEKMCGVNASRIAIPIEFLVAYVVNTRAIVFVVFLGSVTMHNTHVRVDRNPDLFSFNACVNAARIAISILVGSRSRSFGFA